MKVKKIEEFVGSIQEIKKIVFLISYDISKKGTINEEMSPNQLFKKNFNEFIEELNKAGKYGKIKHIFYVESTIKIDLIIKKALVIDFADALTSFFIEQKEIIKDRTIKYIFLHSEKVNLYPKENR